MYEEEPKITRIDVRRNPEGGTLIQKWYEGWKAGQAPSLQYQSDWEIEQVYEWLMSDQGFFVAKWPLDTNKPLVGLRAFEGGEPAPVRTAIGIKKMRIALERDLPYYRQLGIEPSLYNLAIYL